MKRGRGWRGRRRLALLGTAAVHGRTRADAGELLSWMLHSNWATGCEKNRGEGEEAAHG